MRKTTLFIPVLFLMIILASCASQPQKSSSEGTSQYKDFVDKNSDQPILNNSRNYETRKTAEQEGLGSYCTGKIACEKFCHNHQGECESYCRNNHENPLCRLVFLPRNEARAMENRKPDCTGTGTVLFTSPPMRIEDIDYISPIGQMIGGHVTPIDHGYYTAKDWNPQQGRNDASIFKEVLAPANGIVQSVQSMPKEFQSSSLGDYRIIIDHTCTFYTIYIHVNQLSPKLQAIADTGRTAQVTAGEVIGKAPGFDFSAHDEQVILPGFIVPAHYNGEPWKIHTVDMFNSFAEPIRTQLLEKNIRQQEPQGGKIDYDIDGKLVGNWFEKNTNWYVGRKELAHGYGYWATHLSFAYDGLDPRLVIVSMGNFSNEAMQFAVKENTPNPASIGVETGLVKYMLTRFDYWTNNGRWDRKGFAKITKAEGEDLIEGTVLVRMLDKRTIEFESFPGKKSGEVHGFTENAKFYER